MTAFTCLFAVTTCLVILISTNVCARSPPSVNIATYNAGLTPRVKKYEDRREKIGSKLQSLAADVVCVQEIWYSSDLARIITDTRDKFPFSYSALHYDIGQVKPIPAHQSPCSGSATRSFLKCFYTNCGRHRNTRDMVRCARDRCDMMSLEQQCITCLVLSSPKTIIQSCLRSLGNHFNVPGLALLSNRPISSVTVTPYQTGTKLLIPRSYISAEVEDLGTVVCTHTTADLGDIYYENLNYGSWAAQNLDEARFLIASLQHVQNAVVLGDLNSSPEVATREVSSDMPGAYQLFRQHGYQSPYVDDLGICTWCVYNPLAGAKRNMILDHVLLKNHTVLGTMRIMDSNIEDRDYPLSDHFGIKVVLYTP